MKAHGILLLRLVLAHIAPFFRVGLLAVLLAVSLLGCARRWTVNEIRARNPHAWMTTYCNELFGVPPDAEFVAVGPDSFEPITDLDFRFAWHVPKATGFYRMGLSPRVEYSACHPDPYAIPVLLRDQLEDLYRQSCAVPNRPNPRFLGQVAPPVADSVVEMIVRALTWTARRGTPPPPPTKEHPAVQFGGGFAAGTVTGAIPGGGVAADVAIESGIIARGTYWARVGKACGEIAAGTGQIILGCGGTAAGAGVTSTGGGAPAGLLVMSGSIEIAGAGCVAAGHGLGQLLVEVWRGNDDPPASSSGPAPSVPAATPPPVAKPPPKPAAAPPPVAKPPATNPPTATRTVTHNKTTGVTKTQTASGTRTTTQPRAAVAKELSKEAQRGIRSLEKRIAEHEQKLAEFRANPTVRPGMEGQPKGAIDAAQQSRIKHLEKEIRTFKENIDKLKRGE
jgi:hypothetical protein